MSLKAMLPGKKVYTEAQVRRMREEMEHRHGQWLATTRNEAFAEGYAAGQRDAQRAMQDALGLAGRLLEKVT